MTPVDARGWVKWLGEGTHDADFRAEMKTVGADRRTRSTRMKADASLPDPLPNQPHRRQKVPRGWPSFLRKRGGWHGVKPLPPAGQRGPPMQLVFLLYHDHETHWVAIPPTGHGRWFVPATLDVRSSVRPLCDLVAEVEEVRAGTWKVSVWEVVAGADHLRRAAA